MTGDRLPGAPAIARVWRGATSRDNAAAYQQHLRTDTLPGLERLDGYRGAYVIRRELADEVEFVVVTLWDSIDAIRGFVEADYRVAVIPAEARRLLSAFDEMATHYDVAVARLP